MNLINVLQDDVPGKEQIIKKIHKSINDERIKVSEYFEKKLEKQYK